MKEIRWNEEQLKISRKVCRQWDAIIKKHMLANH